MAIFEKEFTGKVELDDTQTIQCFIENWRNINGYTEFIIRIQRGPFPDNSWRIYRRYNDFCKLHSYLQTSGLDLQFPPKKFIGNKESEFIAERLRGLQKYLNRVVMNPILISSLPARSFIDPANYCQPFSEMALQHVSLALRGEMGWEVASPLEEIGWRLRKHFYQIRCKSSPKEEFIGSWTDYGPDKYLSDKDMETLLKSLNQMQHPYIYNGVLGICTDFGALVVRKTHKIGSMRDELYNVKPWQSFLKKYGNPKGHKPLETKQVALYGRQILEALKFLNNKGIPYGHLHTGNIIIDGNKVKLLDIENGILGVPSFYRPYFIQHRKINTMESVDVYCFGHALYEMSFGTPLQESFVDSVPSCPSDLKNVLESILSLEAFKSKLPTIESLIQHKFFSSAVLDIVKEDACNFKVPSATRDRLKASVRQIEERLKDEQKNIRSQKRLVRVQEMMSSEEEKKKLKNKQRQEQKLVKEQNKHLAKESRTFSQEKTTSEKVLDKPETHQTINGPATVPNPPPNAPPPPPIEQGISSIHVTEERSALLGEICNFNINSLRKRKDK